MKKDNIFLEDVVVPEIVQKKAAEAFFAIQEERSGEMKRMAREEQFFNEAGRTKTKRRTARTLVAAAACMAVIGMAGALMGSMKGIFGGSEDAVLTAVNQIDKMFTLQVKAAGVEGGQFVPLAEENPIPVSINDNTSWVFDGDDRNGGTLDYCIGMPQITCEGEQVESITYSINNGAFQVVQPENGESIIVDGQLFDRELNVGSIGGDYNEERNGEPSEPFETVFYQSFTLDFERQSDAHTWINICDERTDSEEIIQLLWSEDGSKEKQCSGIQKMLENTVITCTVNYEDGTSQSADLKLGSCLMTRREAGEPMEDGVDLEEEITVITCELQ